MLLLLGVLIALCFIFLNALVIAGPKARGKKLINKQAGECDSAPRRWIYNYRDKVDNNANN